jgi:hypothetical protein
METNGTEQKALTQIHAASAIGVLTKDLKTCVGEWIAS